MKNKKCYRCGKTRPIGEFYKAKTRADGLQSKCKSCSKECQKEYRQTESGKKVGIKYRQTEKGKKVEKKITRKYYLAHSKELIIYHKKYNQIHREEIAIQQKKHRQTEKGKAIHLKNEHKRRALKAGVNCEDFNTIEVFERDGYQCQLCGKKTRPDFKNSNHPLYPNLDHIVPLSKGGDHSMLNTQCLCHQCNIEKHNTGEGNQFRLFG